MKNLLRLTLAAALLGVVLAVPAKSAALPAQEVRLQPLPAHTYKTHDTGNERTESWILWLLVETGAPSELSVQSAKIELYSGQQVVRTTNPNLLAAGRPDSLH